MQLATLLWSFMRLNWWNYFFLFIKILLFWFDLLGVDITKQCESLSTSGRDVTSGSYSPGGRWLEWHPPLELD